MVSLCKQIYKSISHIIRTYVDILLVTSYVIELSRAVGTNHYRLMYSLTQWKARVSVDYADRELVLSSLQD